MWCSNSAVSPPPYRLLNERSTATPSSPPSPSPFEYYIERGVQCSPRSNRRRLSRRRRTAYHEHSYHNDRRRTCAESRRPLRRSRRSIAVHHRARESTRLLCTNRKYGTSRLLFHYCKTEGGRGTVDQGRSSARGTKLLSDVTDNITKDKNSKVATIFFLCGGGKFSKTVDEYPRE